MNEEMEDWTSGEDSEDERDIEIALYSQIHFDSVSDVPNFGPQNNNSVMNMQNPQFQVGIEEMSFPVKINNTDCSFISSDDGEVLPMIRNAKHIQSSHYTIYVTSSDEEDTEFVLSDKKRFDPVKQKSDQQKCSVQALPDKCLSKETREASSNTSKDELIICEDIDDINNTESENDDTYILEVLKQMGRSHSKNEVMENSNPVSDQALSLSSRDINTKGTIEPKMKVQQSKDSPSYVTKVTQKSSGFLPFSITKSSLNKQEFLSEGSESSTEGDLLSQAQDRDGLRDFSSPKTSSENFLRFSKGKVQKGTNLKTDKKKLSKQEAAVLPRKPAVYVRKPSAAKANFEQDSDTNTDYSDSDISLTASPLSKKYKHSGQKSTKHYNRDGPKEGPSSSSLSSSYLNSGVAYEIHRQDNERSHFKLREDNTYDSEDDDKNEAEKKSPRSRDSDSSLSNADACPESDSLHHPSLYFNLKGGVEGLLKNSSSSADKEKWQIMDKDRYQILMSQSRYFCPSSLTCRNCNQDGHKAANCPNPKRVTCVLCSNVGHVSHNCPILVCNNCYGLGHHRKDCREPLASRRDICNRCWMPGHFEEICPDNWRQYHLTCDPSSQKLVTSSKKHQNPKTYCFNCGKKGHLGYECKEVMMNRYIFPNYPFIARYNKNRYSDREMGEDRGKSGKKKKLMFETKDGKNKEHKGRKIRREEYNRSTDSKQEKRKYGREDPHKTRKRNRKDSTENEQSKDHENVSKFDTGKHLKNHWDDERNLDLDSRRIMTESTVYTFQEPVNEYHEERGDNFYPVRDKADEDKRYHRRHHRQHHHHHYYHHSRENSTQDENPYGDYEESEYWHENEIERNHQVFHNEWWKGESSTSTYTKKQHRHMEKNSAHKNKKYNYKDKYARQHSKSGSESQNRDIAGGKRHFDNGHSGDYSKKRKKDSFLGVQDLQISFHNSRHKHSTKRSKTVTESHQHTSHHSTTKAGYSKKRKKSGFQMNAHFQSLSTSCKQDKR